MYAKDLSHTRLSKLEPRIMNIMYLKAVTGFLLQNVRDLQHVAVTTLKNNCLAEWSLPLVCHFQGS